MAKEMIPASDIDISGPTEGEILNVKSNGEIRKLIRISGTGLDSVVINDSEIDTFEIVNSHIDVIDISRSNISLLSIANSAIKSIDIRDATGVNWTISNWACKTLDLRNISCIGDFYVKNGELTDVQIDNCKAGDHFTFSYSGPRDKEIGGKLTINKCPRLQISASKVNIAEQITIKSSLVMLDFNDVTFHNLVSLEDSKTREWSNRGEFSASLYEEKSSYGWQLVNCKFNAGLKIGNSNIQCPLELTDSTISKLLDLRGSSFGEWTDFTRATLTHSNFDGVKFHSAIFINTVFTGPANFSYCQFELPPQFMGADLHQGTTFHGAKFALKSVTNAKEASIDDYNLEAMLAFRVLKIHMAKIRSQNDELKFFVLETRMERRLTHWRKSPFSKILSLAYDAVSSYGSSPGQAFAALCLWNVAFYVLFSLLILINDLATAAPNYPYRSGIPIATLAVIDPQLSASRLFANAPVVGLVIQNALNPLALISSKPLISTKSWWIFALSIFQSAGVIAIVTLLLLAIRSRFQKGRGGE